MGLSQRAVVACEMAMRKGKASERLIRDILKYTDKPVDVACIEPFLKHESPMIRKMAARVIGAKGNVDILVAAALKEENSEVLVEMMNILGACGGGIESLVGLLSSKDSFVKDSAIEMFRRAGKTDCLFPLLFDSSDLMVFRIKRYLDEKSRKSTCFC